MRGTLRSAFAILLASSVLLPATGSKAEGEPPAPPNIVVFVTDDQPVGTMEAMPATSRWFQQEGTWFPNAVVTTPLCCPSRSSIFSGRYAHNHGVTQNSDPELATSLDQTKTIQYALSGAGYRTGLAGKYLNAWPIGMDPPSFDRWASHSSSTSYYNPNMNLDGVVQQVTGFEPDLLAGFAESFLDDFETTDDQPFFLYVATMVPHKPFSVPLRHQDDPVTPWDPDPAALETDRSDKPPIVQAQSGTPQEGVKLRDKQMRALLAADDMVDRVMTRLVELGEDQNTLAIFLSDNGMMWGHHGMVAHKRLPYLQSVVVPFGVRWPGNVGAGAVDGRTVANVDLASTIADATDVTLGWEPDGQSLLDPGAVRRRILLEYFQSADAPGFPAWASFLTPSRQYTEYYANDGVTVTFREYYDLLTDPWQNQNLLGDDDPNNDPDVSALSQALAEQRVCTGAACLMLSDPDSGPPSEPGMPTAGLNGSGEVIVEWDPATDDVGVGGYEISRDGEILARVGRDVRYADRAAPAGELHTYGVRAFDVAGNTSDMALAPEVRVPAAGSLLVDGFESRTLSIWSTVKGASAAPGGRTGRNESWFTSAGTPSFVRKVLPKAPSNSLVKADVKLRSRGDGPVILLRGLDADGLGVVHVFVRMDGTLAYKVEGSKKVRRSGVPLPLGEWHTIGLQVAADGASSVVELRLDGVLIAGRVEATGIEPIGRVQLGDHLKGRTYDLRIDDVVARRLTA